MSEADVKKEYADAGVDLPELKEEAAPEPEKEPAPESPEPQPEQPEGAEPQGEKPEGAKDEGAPLQPEPKEQRKRSIYDEYKDKKAEAKSEKERADKAEADAAELRKRLEAYEQAETPAERREAQDDIDAFAKEIKADPSVLRKMRDLFVAGIKPPTDEALAKDLADFKAWKEQNAAQMELQMFDKEFQSITPQLKEYFPNATDEEMASVRKELDTISHTKEWHDKSLDYIAFKHRDQLNALVSPKKKGMEPKGRREGEAPEFEFDPNADLTKLSPEARAKWEEKYHELTRMDGLATSAEGKKIII